MKNIAIFISLFLGVLGHGPSLAEILSVGIPPQQSPVEVVKRWTPILLYLERKTGLILELKTAKDIPTHLQQIMDGLYDIAYLNPNSYIVANKVKGYQAFAQERDGKAYSVIVARKNGPITQLTDLNERTMAFPSPSAVMATILPLKHLEEQKIAVRNQYVVSLDSVYRSIAKGLFLAGGGESRTFSSLDPEIRDQLVVLWQSQELPPFPFIAHPRVPTATLNTLQKAMVAMSQDPEGQALLKVVNIKGLEKSTDADYNSVRKLNLPLQVK